MNGPWIAAFIAVSLVALFNGAVTVGLLRRIGSVLERAEAILQTSVSTGPGGLPAGSAIPEFEAHRADGSAVGRSEIRHSTIVFMSSGCQPCKRLAADLREHWLSLSSVTSLVVVLNDPSEADELDLPGDTPIIYQRERRMAAAFRSSATPHVFVTDGTQIIGNGTPNSIAGVFALIPARKEVRTSREPALPAR